MKQIKSIFILFILFFAINTTCVFAKDGMDVYRLYNETSGEHLYTTDANEADILATQQGWTDEGTGWTSPENGEPVYRLYNATLADHLYTKDQNEVNVLTTQQNWQLDNSGNPIYYSDGSLPIYRLYNPTNGRHHLTTDINENNTLGASGVWQPEGVGFSALVENEIPGIENIKNHYRDYINFVKDFCKENADDDRDCPDINNAGYALVDLERDGQKELLIGTLDDPYHFNSFAWYLDTTDLNSCKNSQIGTSAYGGNPYYNISFGSEASLLGKNKYRVRFNAKTAEGYPLDVIRVGSTRGSLMDTMGNFEPGSIEYIKVKVDSNELYYKVNTQEETNLFKDEYKTSKEVFDSVANLSLIPISFKPIDQF